MIGIRYYGNGQNKYFLNYKVNSIWTLNFVYDFLSRFLTVTHLISLFTSVICIKVEKQVTGITNLSDKILILIYNKNSYLEIILAGSFIFNLFNFRQHKIIIVSRLTKFLSRFLQNEGEQFCFTIFHKRLNVNGSQTTLTERKFNYFFSKLSMATRFDNSLKHKKSSKN